MRAAPDDLRIRRAEPDDYAAVRDIMSGPVAIAGTLQLPFPSLELWRERMAKHETQDCMLVAEARADRANDPEDAFRVVGHLGLNVMRQQRRSHAAALGISVRDDWQGRGVGGALLSAALDRADGWMHVLRIELTVFADNAAALALYRRHGFVVEGTHRAYALRDGVYVDAIAMARLHPRPPAWPTVVVE